MNRSFHIALGRRAHGWRNRDSSRAGMRRNAPLIYLAASDQYYGREIRFVLCAFRRDALCWLRRAYRDGSCRLVTQNGAGAPETTAGQGNTIPFFPLEIDRLTPLVIDDIDDLHLTSNIIIILWGLTMSCRSEAESP